MRTPSEATDTMRSLRPRKSIRRKVAYRDPISHGSLKGCFFGYSSCSSVFLCFAHYSSVPSVCQAVFFLAHGSFPAPETCSAASRNTGHGLPHGKVDTRQGGRMRGGRGDQHSTVSWPPREGSKFSPVLRMEFGASGLVAPTLPRWGILRISP